VWAAGGEVLHYEPSDAGGSFDVHSVSEQPTPTFFTHVWGSAQSGVWVAGTRKQPDEEFFDEVGVFRMAAGATEFTEVTLPLDPDEHPTFAKLSILGGAAPAGSTVMWIFGRTVSSVPGIWKGTSADDGVTFDFVYQPNGKNDEPQINAVWALAANDSWAVGDYGKVRRWNGTTWLPTAVALTKYPVIDPFYAVWGRAPNDVWIVGDEIALRLDPTKVP
jgi:hypothetical protein